MKREQLFMQLLEGLHPDEAEIICLVKDKNLKKKYKLTRAIVEEHSPIYNGVIEVSMAKTKTRDEVMSEAFIGHQKKKKI